MADPWRDRAKRVVESRRLLRTSGDPRPHYVVCGQDALAFHVVNALLAAEVQAGSMRVTVIVPRRRRVDGPEIRTIRGIRLLEADRLDEETFRTAGLAGASGLALLHQNDVGNIHAALCAQAVEPELRTVLRMFNTSLARKVRQLLPHCTVLSDAAMAAPALVAAALGEVDPTHFRYGDRTLHVARRPDVRPEDVVCGLADTSDPGRLAVLPTDQARADLVLAKANGRSSLPPAVPDGPVRQRRRWRPVADLLRALRSFATRKIGVATLVILAVIAVLGVVLSFSRDNLTLGDAFYLAIVTTLSGADASTDQPTAAKITQVVLNLAGLALVPLITAAVVDGIVNARLALTAGRLEPHRAGHVVLVGLGNVGTRVMAQLHDLGIEVVAIDRDPTARGVPVAQRLGIPVITGDAAREQTLATASVGTARALLVLSTDDVTNLQAALFARAARPDLRVVLRLFDGDFAARIQKAFDIGISRSVSYLAAPSFAAALLDRAVIATIPIQRHVLLVAEVPVAAGSALVGRTIGNPGPAQAVRVIAVTRTGGSQPEWSPSAESVIGAGDRLTVVVRRAGLSWLLKQAGPNPPSPPPDQPARPAGPVPTPRRGGPTPS